MDAINILVVCSLATVVHGNQMQVTLEADRPSQRVPLSHTAFLQCCFTSTEGGVHYTWTVRRHNVFTAAPLKVNITDNRVTVSEDKKCRSLTLREVQLNDTGLYQCCLNHSALNSYVFTHGTFLQVYKPIEQFLNISETTKNKILIVEGLLLFLCVLIPGYLMLSKSKRLNELQRIKSKREEENIYEVMTLKFSLNIDLFIFISTQFSNSNDFIQEMVSETSFALYFLHAQGLNLDECCSTYDQIQHSRVQGPYQDVGYVVGEEIQLEKP